MLVYGTRPEAIKLAPIIEQLHRSNKFEPVVALSGQHREMLDQVNGAFGIKADHDLSILRPRQQLSHIMSATLTGVDEILSYETPDALMVQGDTTTSTAAALAAFNRQVPVVHVEAGLRSGSMSSPFPEEGNRKVTSQLASLHLAPTLTSKANLLREGVTKESIVVTGNSVIDALLSVVRHSRGFSTPSLEAIDGMPGPLVLVTAHRRENHGVPMRCIAEALRELVLLHPNVKVVLPLHRNPAVREVLLELRGLDRILLVEPLRYSDFALLLQRATVVLTDSGGVQEEAPALGKPVLVMRTATERPEAIAAGTVKLVGVNPKSIVRSVSELLSDAKKYERMAQAVNPYGDGAASRRTVDALTHFFGDGPPADEFMAGAE